MFHDVCQMKSQRITKVIWIHDPRNMIGFNKQALTSADSQVLAKVKFVFMTATGCISTVLSRLVSGDMESCFLFLRSRTQEPVSSWLQSLCTKSYRGQTHQTYIKKLVGTKADCGVTSCSLCLDRKAAVERTAKTKANSQQPTGFFILLLRERKKLSITPDNRQLRTVDIQPVAVIKHLSLFVQDTTQQLGPQTLPQRPNTHPTSDRQPMSEPLEWIYLKYLL